MANTPAQKKEIIDKLNDAFINRAVDNTKRDFEIFFNRVVADTLAAGLGDSPKLKDIQKIVDKIPISRTAMLRQTYNMTALSAIINTVQNARIDPEDMRLIKPILPIVARYSVNNPELLARKVDKLSKASITRISRSLSKSERSLFKNINQFYTVNDDFIKQELAANREHLRRVHAEIKTNISKTILKDLKREIRTRVDVVVVKDGQEKVVTRPQTFEEVRDKLRDKFGDQLDYRVRRIVDTEMHDLSEKTTLNHHLLLGYTHKVWQTQKDARVRRPTPGSKNKANHVAMQGKEVPIKSKFKVVGGGTALYPGDPSLPPGQRINCRCFLTYVKRKS